MSEQPAARLDPKAMASFDALDDDDFSMTASLRAEDPPAKKKTPARTTPKTDRNRPARTKSAATPEPEPPANPQSASRGSGIEEPLRPTAFNISHELVAKFREHRDRHNWQGGQVVIAAIEATYKDGSLREALHAATAEVTVGGHLFEPVVNKHTFRDGLRRIDVQLKSSHFAVLDRLMKDLGAEDRSQLVDAALRAYLTPQTTRKETDDH